MKTSRNLGYHERIIRIGIGIGLLAISGLSLLPGWPDLLLIIIGLIALVTGIIGHCPAWQIMGLNTCSRKTQKPSPAESNPKFHGNHDPSIH